MYVHIHIGMYKRLWHHHVAFDAIFGFLGLFGFLFGYIHICMYKRLWNPSYHHPLFFFSGCLTTMPDSLLAIVSHYPPIYMPLEPNLDNVVH